MFLPEIHARDAGGRFGPLDAIEQELQSGLGEVFTPDVRGARTAVYTLLAGTMQRGAACAMTPGVAAERAPAAAYV